MQTVLIVDDSKTERELMARAVSSAGFSVVFAEDGNEAVEKAKSMKPSLILMDVVMPNLNGFNATRAIKSDEATKNIPVVLVTTKSADSDKFWGKKQGADGHIAKPYSANDIVDVVRRFAR